MAEVTEGQQFGVPYNLLIEELLNDAKYFLQLARNHRNKDEVRARTYARAAIITTFAALESRINFHCWWIAEHGDVQPHEEAFLREQRLELTRDGYFDIVGSRFYSLEDKIRFLHWHSKGEPIDTNGTLWKLFLNVKRVRDRLVHPKPEQASFSQHMVESAKGCLIAVTKIMTLLASESSGGRAVHKKP